MKRWFDALPIHRKLMIVAGAVSLSVLSAAIVGLVAVEAVRLRAAALDDTHALARVLAENTEAAVVFGDIDDATQTLATVHVRAMIRRACLYGPDGSLFASFEQTPPAACPRSDSGPTKATTSWRSLSVRTPVSRNGRLLATIVMERSLSDVQQQVAVTAAAGLFMLAAGTMLAFALSHWLQRRISGPIVALAAAANEIGHDQRYEMRAVEAPPDEVGQLVRAFNDMVVRVRDANLELVGANDQLRREVEERRRAEHERELALLREREASRLKDEFLAAVSHELRTPLHAMLGWLDILARTKPGDPLAARAMETVARNASAQKRVIEDLVDISRIVTGKMNVSLVPMDLRAALESAVEVIGPTAKARDIELAIGLPGVPCPVQADPDRLRQVFWNLLSNAVKFTAPGGRVAVDVAALPATFRVSVTDTGIGIDPEFVPHVFQRFRQADGSTTRAHGGLGLGLAIVKELTELQGGTVTAASLGSGMGATFTVTLPRLAAIAAAGEQLDGTAAHRGPRFDGVRVLVVDDHRDSLDSTASALRTRGAIVRCAASGADALRQWHAEPADVLLCDLAMPDIDGFAVLEQIQRADRALGRMTKAVAMTAFASQEYRDKCTLAGFQWHLAKPFSEAALFAAVAGVLSATRDGWT